MFRSHAPSRRPGLRRGRIAAGVCAVALIGALPATAAAQDRLAPFSLFGTASGTDRGLIDFLLPYSPYIFDLVVQLSRSVVAVTYDSRGYDPITHDFVVSGLKIGRNDVDVAIDRIRFNASTSLFEGIAIDTRNIPMEPEAREALKKLDSEIIRGSIVSSAVADAASASYDIDLKADFQDIGALAIAAKVEGFHLLVPLDGVAAEFETPPLTDGEMPAPPPPPSDVPVLLGKLVSASLSYDDAGLTPAGFAIAAEAQNMATDELRGMMAMMLTPMVSSLFEELPGGASPELKERALGWSTALNGYLADPQHLEITFSPEEPFDLSRIKPGITLDEPTILALNPDVTTVATERTALLDPETREAVGNDDMSLARRLVEGLGIPQDIGRGVALALADETADKSEATATIVRGIVLDPEAAVSADTAAASYTMLVVAKARGEAVPDGVMATVRARLSAEQVTAAENGALEEWRGTDDSGQADREKAVIDARDWGGLRDIALDYYEGTSVPRNVTRAYTFAQLSAAGGDRIGTTLRDDLLAALRDKRLSFSADAGREEANTIWQTIVTAAKADAGPDDAPANEAPADPAPADGDAPAEGGTGTQQ